MPYRASEPMSRNEKIVAVMIMVIWFGFIVICGYLQYA